MTIQQTIEQKVADTFAPQYMELLNESHNHNVPEQSETHFKLTLVTDQFQGMNRVKRHQALYGLLAEELAGPVHALALHLYTPDEWQKTGAAPVSPNCRGGNGK